MSRTFLRHKQVCKTAAPKKLDSGRLLQARGRGTLAAPQFRYLGAARASPPSAARELVGSGGLLPLGGTKIAHRGRVGSCGLSRTGGFW
jgi:hypothetical protein